ncbi:MAG TPA: MFS transporter [Acidobacteriota bacterium]|nr:MFS transporter [Acidobacteriota bacterium]
MVFPVAPRLPQEQWRRNRLAINIAAALVYAGFTFVMPFLPLYVKELGIQGDAEIATWSGILITVAPLLAGFLGPLWGRMGDRYGMKIMVERCILALALHWGFFGFAANTYHLLVLRIVLGMFGGFGILAMPLLVSTTPREHMSRSIGYLQTVQMISSAVGPLIGGMLADWIGIRSTCLVSTALNVLGLILVNRLYREGHSDDRSPKSGAAERISLREAAALPAFGTMIAVIFSVNFVERSFTPVVPLYILQLGTSLSHAAKTAGLILSLGLLSEAISASVLGNQLRTIAPRKLLLWRLAAGLLVSFPMGLVWSTSQLLLLRLLMGLLAGGCVVVVYTLGSRVIPAHSRATSFSFLSSSGLLGASLGPVVAGALTHLSLRAIFFFNSFVFLLLLALSYRTVGGNAAQGSSRLSEEPVHREFHEI